jgi:hypothetical protein
MNDRVEEIYKYLFENTDKNLSSLILIQIIEQRHIYNSPQEPELQKRLLEMIYTGSLFLTSNNTISIPLLFITKLFNSFGTEWNTLKEYISKGIIGEVSSIDIEKFPCYFYAFKVHLYQNLNIKTATMRQFFKGVYMDEVNN